MPEFLHPAATRPHHQATQKNGILFSCCRAITTGAATGSQRRAASRKYTSEKTARRGEAWAASPGPPSSRGPVTAPCLPAVDRLAPLRRPPRHRRRHRPILPPTSTGRSRYAWPDVLKKIRSMTMVLPSWGGSSRFYVRNDDARLGFETVRGKLLNLRLVGTIFHCTRLFAASFS